MSHPTTSCGYRMLAIDLDGTLLSPDGEVTPRTRLAVRNALWAGYRVCFATGRNVTESRAILEAAGHVDTGVFVGGAMVVDVPRGRTLKRTAMHPELAAEVCEVFESMNHAALALQDTGEAGVDYLVTADAPQNEATRRWMLVTEAKTSLVSRLSRHPHPHTIRVGICADPDEVLHAEGLIKSRFGSRVVCHCLHVPAYNVEVMEVFDPAVSKWDGILHVASMHGIAPHEIVAVGDDVNDLTMIQGAGLGVAMANAKPQVRAAADRVIGPNSRDGLAEFIEELTGVLDVGRCAGCTGCASSPAAARAV